MSQQAIPEQLTLGVVSGTPPDVVTLPAPFIQYQIGGLIQPIDDYMARSDYVRAADYPPQIMDTFAVNGRLYGVPAIEVAVGLVLIYSKDLFAEAGLPDHGPTSLTELYDMHRILTRRDGNNDALTQIGINPLDSMGSQYFPTIWSTVFNVDWYDEAFHELRLTELEPAVEWIRSIYETHGYGMITGSGVGGWTGGLHSGRLAMQVNGSWVPGELKALDSPGSFGYTWMPTSTGDKATASLPWGLAIPNQAAHPDLSFQLMEFFTTAEAAQILFDAAGWLNGNLPAMQQLEIGDLPEIAPIIGMFEEADRFNAPPPVPIMEEIRRQLSGALAPVWRNEEPGRTALHNLQRSLQIRLNEALVSGE